MAFSKLYVCDTCPADVTLVFAEEWTRGTGGRIETYAGWGKVGGLVNRLWCPACHAVQPHLLVQLNPPSDHAVVAYAEAQRLGLKGTETGPCPQCATELLTDIEAVPCPTCETGILRFTGEWEDAV
jgi:hypothetical protein